MRLIDADEYIEKLRDRIGIEPTWNHSGLRIAIFELHNMPTIDPVKHGRWTGRRSIAAPNRYECSVCKRMTIVDECIGEPMYAYCPWCGAELKGEE